MQLEVLAIPLANYTAFTSLNETGETTAKSGCI
jgi:hypothetical protein